VAPRPGTLCLLAQARYGSGSPHAPVFSAVTSGGDSWISSTLQPWSCLRILFLAPARRRMVCRRSPRWPEASAERGHELVDRHTVQGTSTVCASVLRP